MRRALDPVTTDKVVQQYGDPARTSVLIRMPLAAQQEGNGARSERQRDRRCADQGQRRQVRGHQHRDRRPGGRQGPAAEGHLCDAGVARRHPHLHRAAVPVQLRPRRDRRHLPRHHRHDGVPGVLQLRPVAERDRGDSDHHRLLGERHHRHLRPHPREPALQAPRVAGEGRQRQRQPDAVAHHHHRRDDPVDRAVAVFLRRRGAERALRSR